VFCLPAFRVTFAGSLALSFHDLRRARPHVTLSFPQGSASSAAFMFPIPRRVRRLHVPHPIAAGNKERQGSVTLRNEERHPRRYMGARVKVFDSIYTRGRAGAFYFTALRAGCKGQAASPSFGPPLQPLFPSRLSRLLRLPSLWCPSGVRVGQENDEKTG
jgi:hypothetical protein